MKTMLILFLLSAINMSFALADELYVWTDENGVTHSSTTRPEDWKEQHWEHSGTAEGRDRQNSKKGERTKSESLRPRASFGSHSSGAVVGPGVSSGVTIEK